MTALDAIGRMPGAGSPPVGELCGIDGLRVHRIPTSRAARSTSSAVIASTWSASSRTPRTSQPSSLISSRTSDRMCQSRTGDRRVVPGEPAEMREPAFHWDSVTEVELGPAASARRLDATREDTEELRDGDAVRACKGRSDPPIRDAERASQLGRGRDRVEIIGNGHALLGDAVRRTSVCAVAPAASCTGDDLVGFDVLAAAVRLERHPVPNSFMARLLNVPIGDRGEQSDNAHSIPWSGSSSMVTTRGRRTSSTRREPG